MAAVLSCWVVGWVVLPGWRLLSCPAEIRNHFISKLLKSSTALKQIDGIVRFRRFGGFGLCPCCCPPERHLRLRAGSPRGRVGGATVRQ